MVHQHRGIRAALDHLFGSFLDDFPQPHYDACQDLGEKKYIAFQVKHVSLIPSNFQIFSYLHRTWRSAYTGSLGAGERELMQQNTWHRPVTIHFIEIFLCKCIAPPILNIG